ncbi:MAG: hypothetical protein NTX49_04825 [Chlamydiae bacterium]|nr:hypothetical protein [Chlamydiota bacterium]
MVTQVIASPASSVACSPPSWERPIKCGKIVRIRTVEAAEFPTVLKVLQVWKKIYSDIPKKVSEGSDIITFFKTDPSYQVLVAEDSRGVAQGFARVEEWSKTLAIEDLVVAPWNNTPCLKYTKGLDWILVHSSIKELAALYKADPKDLVEYTPCTGTLMMYGVLQYAKFLEMENVDLFPSKLTPNFYAKLGLKEEWAKFTWRIADGLPIGILERMMRNFPRGSL